MSRLTLLERTKLNLSEVTIVLKGENTLEIDVLVQIFSGFGARHLRKAENTRELQQAVEAETVDLMVIDAAAGFIDSLEFVRGVRRMSSDSRYAPVILTTSTVMPSMLSEARDAGFSYVVAKPLAPRILFERLIWIVKDARPFIEADGYAGPDRRVRSLGPPAGMTGRRAGDLSAEVGLASAPNMSQADIDAMMFPVRKN